MLRFARRGALPVLLLLLAFTSSSQNTWPKTLLWRISGNGLTKPSYLYGTMHLQDKRLFQFGDSVYHAIEKTEGLAIEIDIKEYMDSVLNKAFSEAEEELLAKKSVTLNRKKLGKTADTLLQKFGIKGGSVSKKELKRIRDYRLTKYMQQGEMPTIVDAYLYGLAMRQDKWVGAVEDVSDQLNLRDELGGDLEPEKVFVPDTLFRNGFESMIRIYQAQDLDGIERISNAGFSAEAKDRWLIQRNVKMAVRMDSLSDARSTFFAVGAAHLPGDSGVIQLLRARGFAVEPVFSKATLKATEYAAGLKQLDWFTVANTDSTYNVQMPGRPSDYNMFGELVKMKMFFDITTMTFYITGNTVAAKSSAEVLQKAMQGAINNMGQNPKVLKSMPLNENGMLGREAIAQIPEATYRMQFWMKDNQLFILMVGSNKQQAVSSADADRFFASLKTYDRSGVVKTWKDFTLPGKAFSLSLPGTPKPNTTIDNSIKKADGWNFTTYDLVDMAEGLYYLIQARDIEGGKFLNGDSAYFAGIKQGLGEKMDEVSEGVQTTFEGFPAYYIDAQSSAGDGAVKTMHVIRGSRVYTLIAASGKAVESPDVDKVFRSLKLLPYETPPVKVQSIEGISAPAAYPLQRLLPDEDEEADSTSTHYISHNPQTAVAYEVWKNAFSPYYWIKNDSTYFAQKEAYYKGYRDSLLHKEWISNGQVKGLDMVIQSPDNNNLKKVRLLVSGDTLYTLTAHIPAQYMRDETHQKFFNDFRIATEQEPSIYTNKAAPLLQALLTTDSVKFSAAKDAFNSVEFTEGDRELLHQALLPSYLDDDESYNGTMEVIVRRLSSIADPSTVDFVKKKYASFTGKKEVHKYLLLKLLAEAKTSASFMLLKELLLRQPPAMGDAAKLEYSLYDSLALTKTLFPEVLQLSRDSLFLSSLTSISLRLLDSSLLTIADIQPHKSNFIKGAAASLSELKKDTDNWWQASDPVKMLGWINDKESNELLKKFLSQKNVSIKREVIVALLKNGQVVPTAEILKVAADPYERSGFYEEMKQTGKLKLFPARYATQLSLAESDLHQTLMDDDYEDFTITPIGERKAMYNGKLQRFCLFKLGLDRDEKGKRFYYLGVTGPYAVDTKEPKTSPDINYYHYDETFNSAKLEAQLKAFLEKMKEAE